MKKIKILIMVMGVMIGGCGILSTTMYANNLSDIENSSSNNNENEEYVTEAIYDLYNTSDIVNEEELTDYALELVNKDYNDNKVHIFGDGSSYLIIYQNEENINYDGENGNITIYPFLKSSESGNNAFYELYTINNNEYPTEYDELKNNNTKFTLDGVEIKVEYTECISNLSK